ncbi:MAG: zinc ribbon domain-containing protein [Deltaproteobacteria bacterium]|nr:zinc ribbon domain-containing protein [Deltaproteobacteria bacterium]
MPIYEYQCSHCGFSFEKLEATSASVLCECPECGKESKRTMSAPAAFLSGGSENRELSGNTCCGQASPCSNPKHC